MKYSLDTNAVIQFLNGRAPAIRERVLAENPLDVVICSIVRYELIFGAMRSGRPEANLTILQSLDRFPALPFDNRAAAAAGMIRADLTTAGTPIGPYDLLIAGIALANNLTLITNNSREFERVNGLNVQDWQTSP